MTKKKNKKKQKNFLSFWINQYLPFYYLAPFIVRLLSGFSNCTFPIWLSLLYIHPLSSSDLFGLNTIHLLPNSIKKKLKFETQVVKVQDR